MECKGSGSARRSSSTVTDLIVTLWNVKIIAEELRNLLPSGFNSYIMECKDNRIARTSQMLKDLIVTLWNVKIAGLRYIILNSGI